MNPHQIIELHGKTYEILSLQGVKLGVISSSEAGLSVALSESGLVEGAYIVKNGEKAKIVILKK